MAHGNKSLLPYLLLDNTNILIDYFTNAITLVFKYRDLAV